jgi:tripartite-type tricarboxylate transporter receptor subunit TctC
MKLPRRNFLHLAAGAAALPAVSRIAWAQSYPARIVRIVVPGAAGNTTDILARLIGQLLLVAAGNVISPSLYDNLNFNFVRDIAPVASIFRVPNVLVVNPSFPVKSVPEFIAYAKANPGKINFASPGIGTSNHMSGRCQLGPRAVSGHGTCAYGPDEWPSAGDIRQHDHVDRVHQEREVAGPCGDDCSAIGIAAGPPNRRRFRVYEASAVVGIAAPKRTPAEIVDRLNREINAALVDPKVKARLADLGGTVLALSPADYGKLNAAEIEKWAKVVKFANIKPE